MSMELIIRHLSAIVNVADKPKPAFPPLIRHPSEWREAEALRERKFNAALARWLAPAPSNPIAERLFACRSQDTKRRFRTFTAVAPLRNKCPGSIEAGAFLFNYSARRNNPTQNSCAVLVMLAITSSSRECTAFRFSSKEIGVWIGRLYVILASMVSGLQGSPLAMGFRYSLASDHHQLLFCTLYN